MELIYGVDFCRTSTSAIIKDQVTQGCNENGIKRKYKILVILVFCFKILLRIMALLLFTHTHTYLNFISAVNRRYLSNMQIAYQQWQATTTTRNYARFLYILFVDD